MNTVDQSQNNSTVPCFHGGAFFTAIGERFDSLDRSRKIINADVLDAWFPPSPKAVQALQDYLPWILRTSPPIDAGGLIETISEVRGVPSNCLLPGAGSSDLIFRAFIKWLKPSSRVLILDPIYSEYPHVLQNVIGCHVERFALTPDNNYRVNLGKLAATIDKGFDLVVLVNPNSPTGQFIPKAELSRFLERVPVDTTVWIDEAYLDYINPSESLETVASGARNVVVCKTMSKVYALSGARVAYLCASPQILSPLRVVTPPWIVGLPAQIAAVNALLDPGYYKAKYEETEILRGEIASVFQKFDWAVVPGCANFLLVHLPHNGPDAEAVIAACRRQNLFLRNPANMGSSFGTRHLRIAVKDRVTNQRIEEILRDVLNGL